MSSKYAIEKFKSYNNIIGCDPDYSIILESCDCKSLDHYMDEILKIISKDIIIQSFQYVRDNYFPLNPFISSKEILNADLKDELEIINKHYPEYHEKANIKRLTKYFMKFRKNEYSNRIKLELINQYELCKKMNIEIIISVLSKKYPDIDFTKSPTKIVIKRCESNEEHN